MNIPIKLNAFQFAMRKQFSDVEIRHIADLEKALDAEIIEEFYQVHHAALWEWMEQDAVNTNTPDSWGGLARFILSLSSSALPSDIKSSLVVYGAERMARIILDSQQKETT